MKRIAGFTLYELVITVMLLAVLASLAFPGFSALLARQKQRVEINTLFGAIHLARKESILKRRVVSICPTADFLQCGARSDWSHGWLMFENVDRDSPPSVDAGETILRRHRVADSISIDANRSGFTLRATFLRATNGTIVVCDSQDRVRPKALVVSYTGRPRVADHRTNGDPYSCAE